MRSNLKSVPVFQRFFRSRWFGICNRYQCRDTRTFIYHKNAFFWPQLTPNTLQLSPVSPITLLEQSHMLQYNCVQGCFYFSLENFPSPIDAISSSPSRIIFHTCKQFARRTLIEFLAPIQPLQQRSFRPTSSRGFLCFPVFVFANLVRSVMLDLVRFQPFPEWKTPINTERFVRS